MLKKIWLLIFCLVLVEKTGSQATSCKNFWAYQTERNEKFGLIRIPNPNNNKVALKAFFSINANLRSKYVGEIDLAKNKQNAITDIENGLPILYRVRFPLQNPLPTVTSIYVNDKLICSSPKGKSATNFFLDYAFSIPKSAPSYKPPVNNFASLNHECGIQSFATITGLVVGGQSSSRGQFPWLAAYYHNGPREKGFICGGSLISSRIIVTAAHCIQNKGESVKRKAEDAIFYLGRHNLQATNEKDYVASRITEFIVHPQWNFREQRFDADIALAIMLTPVQFTQFIKPICLWTKSPSYNDIVGRNGIIAGWGKTEFRATTTATPQWTVIPVVNEGTCVRSNKVFSEVTSSRTFCAGNRLGNTGPCAGGGFVVSNGNKWFLRGLVSSALFDPATLSCDVKNYAIFTDTAKYTNWIQGYIQQYG